MCLSVDALRATAAKSGCLALALTGSMIGSAHAYTPDGTITEDCDVITPVYNGLIDPEPGWQQGTHKLVLESPTTDKSNLVVKMPTDNLVPGNNNLYSARLENIAFSSNSGNKLNIQFLQDSENALSNVYSMDSTITTAPGSKIDALYIDSNLGSLLFDSVYTGVHIFSNLYEGETDLIQINLSGRYQTENVEGSTGTKTKSTGFYFSWNATDASKIQADKVEINFNQFKHPDYSVPEQSVGQFTLSTLSAYNYKDPTKDAIDIWKDYKGEFVVSDNSTDFASLNVGGDPNTVLSLNRVGGSMYVNEFNGPILTLFDYNLRPFVLPADTTLNNVVVAPGASPTYLLGNYVAKGFYQGGSYLSDVVKEPIRLDWIVAGDKGNGHLKGKFAIAEYSSNNIYVNNPYPSGSTGEIIAIFNDKGEASVDLWGTSTALLPIDYEFYSEREALWRQFGIYSFSSATLTLHAQKVIRDESSIAIEGEATGLYIDGYSAYAIKGEIGSADDYFGFKEQDLDIEKPGLFNLAIGIEGEGSLFIAPEYVDDEGNTVKTEVYLGGSNSFSGGLIVGEKSTLHLKDSKAAKNASFLLLEAGSTFTLDSNETLTSFTNVTVQAPALATAGQDTDEEHTVTKLSGVKDGTSGIALAGLDKHVSILQGVKNSEGGSIDAPSETGELKHHVVKLEDFDLSISDGAALWINHIAESSNPYSPANAAFLNQMAILEIGQGSHVSVSGLSGEDSSTSSHIYLGNGSIQVLDGGTLTLGKDSAIHFSQHSEGFFEVNDEKDNLDPHRHASIEIGKGGTINFELGTNNHIYADSILAEGHEHHLISTLWEERAERGDAARNSANSSIFSDDRTINFSITADALAAVKEAIATGRYDQEIISDVSSVEKLFAAAEKQSIDWSQPQKLSALLAALTDANAGEDKLTSEEFYDALGIITTIGMDNRHHTMWQTYVIRANDEGLYMTVAKTNEWDDVTNVRLSLHKSANEVIQHLAGGDKDLLAGLDSTSGAYHIVKGAIEGFTMGENSDFISAARMIDASGQLATVGGAQTIAFDMLQNRRDSLMRHMDAVSLQDSETHLWVDVLGMRNKSFDMWNDLNGDREVKTDLAGFIFGVDRQTTPDWLIGGAFSFMTGSSDTNLGIANQVRTENDIESYSFSLYTRYDLSGRDRIKADLGVQRGRNDLEMKFPWQSGIADSLKADVDTTAVQANVRYEHSFPLSKQISVTPFAGLQYTYLSTEGYTSKLGGKSAWHTEKAEQHVYSIPFGVSLDGAFSYEGIGVRPQIGVYAQPNFGDTEVENVVRGQGLAAVDRVTPEVIGDWSYGVWLGATVELDDRWLFAVDYNFHGSNESRNNAIKASLMYAF